MKVFVLVTLLSAAQAGAPQGSQTQPPPQPPPATGAATNGTATPPANLPAGVAAPADFVIGPNDVLTIVFWRDKDMSSDVSVRPDGKISLPLLNDVQAAGLTPEQLRVQITTAAAKLVEDPTVSVVVKEINSRRVFITGQVAKPGTYALSGPTTVLQLIAMAGGVLEYADSKNITIMRTENGKPSSFQFNYKDVTKRKNLKQNIELKPGDTIIVP
jgi:polysaccharide export outer membrane protein